jgi:hypothetical protein
LSGNGRQAEDGSQGSNSRYGIHVAAENGATFDTEEDRRDFVKRLTAFGAIVLISVCVAFAGPGASSAGSVETSEFQVKAAFVYNFVKFVQWPRDSFPATGDVPISICVLGQDPLGDALESLKGLTAYGRNISVRRIAGQAEIDRCQVLYICKSERDAIVNILKGMKAGVLTIGDMRSFASTGGIINFVIVDNRVSFEINVDAAEKARLRISSQILKLAKIVKEGGGKEER